MPRGYGTGPPRGRGAGAGIGIIGGVSGIVWDLLKKYKKGGSPNSAQGPTVQALSGMETRGALPPPPQATSTVSAPSELEDLKKISGALKDQLDRVAERLAKLEAKK